MQTRSPNASSFDDPAGAPRVLLRRTPKWLRLLPPRVQPRWYHALRLPFSQVPWFCQLGVLLTVLTCFSVLAWVFLARHEVNGAVLALAIFSAAFVVFTLGTTFDYFNSLLALSAAGRPLVEPGVDGAAKSAFLNCCRWAGCFLAGPAVLATAALAYWTYGGDLTWIDWSILAELGVASVAWWLLSLVTINVEGVPIPWPQQTWGVLTELRWRTLEMTLLAVVVFLGHAAFGVLAITRLHSTPFTAMCTLVVCWTSGLYSTAFTFRRLGTAYYLARKPTRKGPRSKSRPISQFSDSTGVVTLR